MIGEIWPIQTVTPSIVIKIRRMENKCIQYGRPSHSDKTKQNSVYFLLLRAESVTKDRMVYRHVHFVQMAGA